MNITLILLVVAYIACNLIVAIRYNPETMFEDFVEGQCIVGMICANIFYLPAWFLKFFKFAVVKIIR